MVAFSPNFAPSTIAPPPRCLSSFTASSRMSPGLSTSTISTINGIFPPLSTALAAISSTSLPALALRWAFISFSSSFLAAISFSRRSFASSDLHESFWEIPARFFCIFSTDSRAAIPATASILRVPADMAPSLKIFIRPSSPVADACVPPHSSWLNEPISTILTTAPYFSSNSAMQLLGTSRNGSSRQVILAFSRIFLLAKVSISFSCSLVGAS
ncbi:unknown [Coraliomargarita sp. CAG:312]|nr:unknown [Coraliomargarita sp. CAG:312]